ncbi:MAG: hypothetical protein JOY57_13895, partial [Actinobacteria bacterium]|nr:hypothetical protein [Actinomycetota bacterium]
MLLAELEVRHSRAIAPTRRVALGKLYLPTDPAPGFGGILLAGTVAAYIGQLDEELRDDLDILIDDLERGKRVVQPRVRHRFQTDTHGLARTHHRLIGVGEAMDLEIDPDAYGLPQVLAAVYAASKLSARFRPPVFALLWRATRWEGDVDARLVEYLTGDEAAYRVRRDRSYDAGWAMTVLGFDDGTDPGHADVVRRFRKLVRDAHPD